MRRFSIEFLVRKDTILKMSVYKNGLIVLLAICVIIPNGTICSTINRNLVDNIQTGINLAGKMLGK